jgi:hypothetical protein
LFYEMHWADPQKGPCFQLSAVQDSPASNERAV